MDDPGATALLSRPGHRPVQGPVDLEGADPVLVPAKLGQAVRREGIRAGQPDNQVGMEGGDHRSPGPEGVAVSLQPDRPATLDDNPVDPAAGEDHPVGGPEGGGQGGADGPAAALGHRHADPLAEQVHDQRVGAAPGDLGLQIGMHPRGDQKGPRFLGGEPVGDGAATLNHQPDQLQQVPPTQSAKQP